MSAPTDHQFIDNPQATAWNYGAATDEEHCFLRDKMGRGWLYGYKITLG